MLGCVGMVEFCCFVSVELGILVIDGVLIVSGMVEVLLWLGF